MTPAERSKKWREDNPERYKKQQRDKYNKRKESYQKFNKSRKFKDTPKWLYSIAKSRAKKKGMDFTISVEDIVIPDVCPILGLKLKPSNNKVAPSSPTLDRVDPSKGYVYGNVRVISHKANNYKRDMTLDVIKSLVKYMEA